MRAATARDIAGRLGLEEHPRSWRGTCPSCDYPRVFSVREKAGKPLLYCANGCNRDSLHEALGRIIAGWQPPPRAEAENVEATREGKRAAALRLWAGSEPAIGTLADEYLTARGLAGLAASPALRFRPDCRHPEGGRLPALIALVLDAASDPRAVHRTYLRPDGGGKTTAEPAKASLGPVWGGAIRLNGIAPEIVVGEGIESSGAAGQLLALPAWAAVSAGNLARGMVLPPEVKRVVIAVDRDAAGERAAAEAACRWQGEGRSVRLAQPNRIGADMADVLMEARHAA